MRAKHAAMIVLTLCAFCALACLQPKKQAALTEKPECKAHKLWSELDRAKYNAPTLESVDQVCGENLVKNECSTEVYCWAALQYSTAGDVEFADSSVAASMLEHLSIANKVTSLNIDHWKTSIDRDIETGALVRTSLMAIECDQCQPHFEHLRIRLRVMPASSTQSQLVELFVITEQLVKLSRSIEGYSLISYSERVKELKQRASEQISRMSVTANERHEADLMTPEPKPMKPELAPDSPSSTGE